MRDLFIKSAGVKTEGQLYDKYPTEESFFKEFPQYKQGGAITTQVTYQTLLLGFMTTILSHQTTSQ